MSLLVSEEPCGCWVEFIPNRHGAHGGHYLRHACEAHRSAAPDDPLQEVLRWMTAYKHHHEQAHPECRYE